MDLKNEHYILRHGETIYQKEKSDFIYPKNPINSVPLTTKGRSQVVKSSGKIKNLGISKIYSSDFLRTRQTAMIVSDEIDFKKDIIFDERLRDLDLGVWHDRKKEEFYNQFPIGKKFFDRGPKKGEDWSTLEERMLDALTDIDKNNEDETVLIVSHGDPLWLLEGKVKNKSREELIKEKKEKDGFIKTAELRKLT